MYARSLCDTVAPLQLQLSCTYKRYDFTFTFSLPLHWKGLAQVWSRAVTMRLTVLYTNFIYSFIHSVSHLLSK